MAVQAILYSFRRCPYAIRARLALEAAGLRPGVDLEVREVNLKARPPELLEASGKGTVPVLVLPGGDGPSAATGEAPEGQGAGNAPADPTDRAETTVLEESLAIMEWALIQRHPGHWLRPGGADHGADMPGRMEALIRDNDGPFKHHLDRFKYPERHPGASAEAHRLGALAILRSWNGLLERGGWLLGDRPCLADMALLPFVRQFRQADPAGFDGEPGLEALRTWLVQFLASPQLTAVMEPPWGLRRIWRSPHWLYHLALAEEWRQARSAGIYVRSTRGLALEQVGFIHASAAHQVEATWRRFYADAGAVVLLVIDPQRLAAAGVPVRWEAAPESGELFPHLYGALPLDAVRLVEPYRP